MMYTVVSTAEYTLRERGSKFIGRVFPVRKEDEIANILNKLRVSYHDATHICYAFSLGMGRRLREGFSDAGEPSGTAGRPILQAIQSGGFTNILVVVIRYFGGTRLGRGGLIRAYGATARETLTRVKKVPYERKLHLGFKVEFHQTNAVIRLLNRFQGEFSQDYRDDGVYFLVTMPFSRREQFQDQLQNELGSPLEILKEEIEE